MYLWVCRAVSSAYVAGVAASVEEKAGPSAYFSLYWKHRVFQLSFCLFYWHNPMEWACLLLLPTRKSSQHGGWRPFPVIPWTNAKQTAFSLSNNSNSMLQPCFVPCYAVVASPFLQKCTQAGTEELQSKSQLWPGGQSLPLPCRWGSVRCQLGSQLPWPLSRFNQAGMKASFTEFIVKLNRPGFDKWTPVIHITGDKLGSRCLLCLYVVKERSTAKKKISEFLCDF